MDETLLHAATLSDIYHQKLYGSDAEPSFCTQFVDRDQRVEIGVFLRPFLLEMVYQVQPFYQLVIFTASEQLYADSILDRIDPCYELFSKRLYRESCLKAFLSGNEVQESKVVFVKDLRIVDGFPLEEVVIVDNSLLSFSLQPDNGIPISSYFYNPADQELRCLANYLVHKLALEADVRVLNREEFKIQNIINLAT
jgi:CTD small phosphatase-like protein 2